MKNLIRIGLIAAMAFAICGCSPADETYELNMAYLGSGDFSAASFVAAAEEIERLTGGNVKIDVVTEDESGGIELIYKELAGGGIDMAFIRAPVQYDIMAEIAYLPFYVTDYSEGRSAWVCGSSFYTEFDELQARKGLKLLGIFPAGFMGLGAKEINPDACFDFSVIKEELFRIPEIETMKIMTKTMGFRSAPLMFSDIDYAFKTGVIQGWIGGGAQVNYDEFRDEIEYYIDYRYANDLFLVLANREMFDSLPPEYQDVIMETFKSESLAAIEGREAVETQALANLKNYGITVIIPSLDERNSMAAYMRSYVWPQLEKKFGIGLIDSFE